MDVTGLQARRDQALGAGAPLFYSTPLHLVRGEGACLFDAEGRRYVDMYNNVPCVGHGNPRVAEAMARAQTTLNVHSRYLHEDILALAERLTALHGAHIQSVVFGCSGTEAVEVALRMARMATGRRGLICSDATYHGNSDLVSQLTRLGGARAETGNIRTIPFPEKYRPIIGGLGDADLADAYLDRLAQAISSLQDNGGGLAALIVCPIFANEGLPDVPMGFMARAAAMVREAGGLVIADEVQAGYGRTGRWWGYQAAGFEPDIVVTGKPMGNGLPLAAAAASRTLVENFRAKTRYFNTFSASPLQGAVGMAVLDEIERMGLVGHVATVGAALKAALAQRAPHWATIGDVRGEGLFIGVEMIKADGARTPDQALAARLAEGLMQRGFLTGHAGVHGNVLKIRPPLVFSQADADAFLLAFDAEMAQLNG